MSPSNCDTVEFFHRQDPDIFSRRAQCAAWDVVYVLKDSSTTEPPAPPTPPGA